MAINTTLLTYGALIVLGGAAIALLMYLLANSGANQRYANAYNQYGGYQGGSYSHYANRRMFDGERYLDKKEGYYGDGGLRILTRPPFRVSVRVQL